MAQLLDSPGSLLHKHRSKIHVVSDIVTNTISSSAVRQELRQVPICLAPAWFAHCASDALFCLPCQLVLMCKILAQGRSVRYLIPEEVRGYIAAHGLYGKGSAG